MSDVALEPPRQRWGVVAGTGHYFVFRMGGFQPSGHHSLCGKVKVPWVPCEDKRWFRICKKCRETAPVKPNPPSGKSLCIGLVDKLYWRKHGSRYHCFKRLVVDGKDAGYISLCKRFERPRSNGQRLNRPASLLRCGACDVAEAKRRGWEDCAP